MKRYHEILLEIRRSTGCRSTGVRYSISYPRNRGFELSLFRQRPTDSHLKFVTKVTDFGTAVETAYQLDQKEPLLNLW